MKLRILIIELDYHAEVLRNLLHLIIDSRLSFTLLVKEKIWQEVGISYDRIGSENLVLTKSKKVGLADFFKQHDQDIASCDLVIFNTLSSNYQFFSRQIFNKPTILRVHNLNSYFRPSSSLTFKFSKADFRFWWLRTFWRREFLFKKGILEKIDYFMFPNERITAYALKNTALKESQILPPVPYTFKTQTSSKATQSEDTICITVIGTVEEKRRDYELLYQAIQKSLPYLSKKVQLTLLGRIKNNYGHAVKTKLQALQADKFEIHTFEKFVDQNVFEQYLKETHFIIIPIDLETRYQVYREVYGQTKISGNENDLIQYGLPAILPTGYDMDTNLEALVERYEAGNSTDLAKKVIQWVNQPLNISNEQISLINEQYSLESQRRKLEEICFRIVGSA